MPSTSETDTRPPVVSANPLGAAAATEDQVPLALNVIATEMMTSVALFSVVTWTTLQVSWASGTTSIEQVTPESAATNLVAFGTVGAILLVAALGWVLLAPVRSPFRRFGVAVVGTLAGTVLSVMATLAFRWALASHGLLLLLVLASAGAWYFFRRTRAVTRALPSSRAR